MRSLFCGIVRPSVFTGKLGAAPTGNLYSPILETTRLKRPRRFRKEMLRLWQTHRPATPEMSVRPAPVKAWPCLHPRPPRLQVREAVRDRIAGALEIRQRRYERDIAKAELVSKIIAAIKLVLEIGVMLLRLALTFRDFSTIALIFTLAQLPKDLEERRHQVCVGIVLELPRSRSRNGIRRKQMILRELVFQILVNDRRIVNDHSVVNQRGNLADEIDREVFGFLVLPGRQIEPGRFPLEPFFQKGYARLARVGSGLVVEKHQHVFRPSRTITELYQSFASRQFEINGAFAQGGARYRSR
jgi:hypothetical protein